MVMGSCKNPLHEENDVEYLSKEYLAFHNLPLTTSQLLRTLNTTFAYLFLNIFKEIQGLLLRHQRL